MKLGRLADDLGDNAADAKVVDRRQEVCEAQGAGVRVDLNV